MHLRNKVGYVVKGSASEKWREEIYGMERKAANVLKPMPMMIRTIADSKKRLNSKLRLL